MDKKLIAHFTHLTKLEMKAKAHKMGSDIIDDLEELSEYLYDTPEIEVIERAILEIRELRSRNELLESRARR